jgi:hypothetical protein
MQPLAGAEPALPMMTDPALPHILLRAPRLGTKLLGTALLTLPLMTAVQVMCAESASSPGRAWLGILSRDFQVWLLRRFHCDATCGQPD